MGKSLVFKKKSYEVEEVYEYKGNKNETKYKYLVSLLRMTQEEIKYHLMTLMREYYPEENIFAGDGYLYVRGIDPVCLTSHMDTTPSVGGKERVPVIDFYEEIKTDDDGNETHILTSPQGIGGDDRCGIWSIITIINETDFRPYIVFCEDEEIGCIGSGKFCQTEYIDELKNCKFLVEIDRRGSHDAVFYDDVNDEFHNFVEEVTGYTEAYGSCSDICNLSAACKVSSVNLSSGYYDEHTLKESIVIEETIGTMQAVVNLLYAAQKDETPQFEYKTRHYDYRDYFLPSRYYDDDNDGWSNKGLYGLFDDDDDELLDSVPYDAIDISQGLDYGFIVATYVIKDPITDDCYKVKVEGENKYTCLAKLFLAYTDLCYDNIMEEIYEVSK